MGFRETPQQAAGRLFREKKAQGYKPVGLYEYTDDNGLTYHRVRLDKDGEKFIRPMHHNGETYVVGQPAMDRSPLYLLSDVLERPDETVYVVEGEKCADALNKVDCLATTSGGANSAGKANWSPLIGRKVMIWPDNDEPGARYAAEVVSAVPHAEIIDVDKLGLPEKGDCVEWLQSNDSAAIPALAVLEASSADLWPEITPLNTSLSPVIQFDCDLLPEDIATWVKDIAERQQCPPDFVAVTVIVALASLIGRKVAIHPMQHDDWLVILNLWGALIGRSSAMKSPAMNEGLKPLKRLAANAHKQYKDDLESFEISKMTNKAVKEANEKDIANAVKKKNKQEIKEAEARAMDDHRNQAPKPSERRYIVNDATVEKLGELLNENPNGLLLERDELTGWLKNLDREDRANDRAFYLEAFNGQNRYTYDRIGRGTIHIESTTVSIIGGIQPARLRPYVWNAVNQGAGDDGLIQRFQLAVYPDTVNEYKQQDRLPDVKAKDKAWAVFKRLDQMEPQTDEEGRPLGVRFDSEGQQVFNKWRSELETKIRQDDVHPAIESHLTKYRSLMPSLALLINIVDHGGIGPVTGRSAAKAAAWCQYFESHANRIYGAAINPAVHSAATILARRGKLPELFRVKDVQQKGWAGLSETGSVKAAIRELEESGYVRAVDRPPNFSGGRPGGVYEWNPNI